MNEIIIFIVIGLIIGFIGGYAGIGGAPFLVVFMTLMLGVSQHTSQGTVLAVMLGPMSLLGIFAMKDRVKKNIRYAIAGVITYAICSYIGAYFAFMFKNEVLQLAFSVLLLVLGINEIFGILNRGGNRYHMEKIPIIYVSIVGVLVGIVGGFFGIGAGILMTPIFMTIFGMEKDDARTLSLMILLPPVSIGAVIKYQMENSILWYGVLIIFVSYFLTNYFGARVALNHSTEVFKKVYGYILVVMGLINLIII